jgi:transcriptional regulator with XRE-family HTH domain
MELGLSQEKLGELAGVQQSEVSRIEAGSVNLSFDGLSKIARACGITVAELMARAKV